MPFSSHARELWAVVIDLAIILVWMLPAAIIPRVPPFAAFAMLVVGMIAFVRMAARDRWGGVVKAHLPDRSIMPRLAAAALLLPVAALLVQAWLYRLMPERQVSSAVSDLTAYEARPYGAAVIALFIILYGPIVEEFVFRRRMIGRLYGRFGATRSIVLAAVLFTALHLNPWTAPFFFALGLIFGVVALRTGTVWTAVLLHAAHNAGAPVLALLVGSDIRVDRWLDRSGAPLSVQALLTAVFVVLAGLALHRLSRGQRAPR